MNILDTLNESQREAVCYNEGPHLVIAGAGSGKTRVLTYKIAYLLDHGMSASSILALTFTNKAAREMKERIGKLVGDRVARYVMAGTFHSIIARILRQEADLLGYTKDFTIYDTTDSKSLIKQIVKELQLDEKIYKVGGVLGYISEAKNNMMSPRDYASSCDYQLRDKISRMYLMADIYARYQARLRAANAMDFDDLLFNMNVLLHNFADVRQKYQELFQYILVDEYQDTNYSQYLIVKCLAERHRRICVVGDDAQSIYSFRGADIRNILQFQSEYPEARLFKLERNYRSTQNIVNAANSLIRCNRDQIPKNVYSENGVGMPLQISSYGNDRDEGKWIAEKVCMLHRKGRSYDDIAVLYRTNAQSRVIEDELRKLGIPYCIYGGLSFYQRKEIKDVLSYFRLITNPRDDEAFLRIVNFPKRSIGDTTLKKVRDCALEHEVNYLDVAADPARFALSVNGPTQKRLRDFAALIERFKEQVDELDAYSFAKLVVQQAGIRAELIADKTQEGIDRSENVDELLTAIREYVELNQQASVDEIGIRSFLSEVALLTDQDQKADDDTPRLTLMTIHSAKGLEYGVIVIAGLEENLFPSMFCETQKELEEERRLFYVAITRAKDECYITSAKSRFKNGQLQFQNPSRFLKDLDSRYVEHAEEEVRRPRWESFDDDWERPTAYPTPSRYAAPSAYTDPSLYAAPSVTPRSSRPSSLKATTGMQPKGDKETIVTPFPIESRVRHNTFGDGTVKEAYRENGNDKLVIIFDKFGPKTMMLQYAKLERI